eukprot:TRINITY_DN7162_c1_g3_i1.p1 TRINITY_DN7162_c1_g3~~TRINITY_DN7162_c1_g3_i1.p1  ORF type:complete len:526 (+),score=101.09 TRINITY_DN7162_c1_g3_i1:107-1684(+)
MTPRSLERRKQCRAPKVDPVAVALAVLVVQCLGVVTGLRIRDEDGQNALGGTSPSGLGELAMGIPVGGTENNYIIENEANGRYAEGAYADRPDSPSGGDRQERAREEAGDEEEDGDEDWDDDEEDDLDRDDDRGRDSDEEEWDDSEDDRDQEEDDRPDDAGESNGKIHSPRNNAALLDEGEESDWDDSSDDDEDEDYDARDGDRRSRVDEGHDGDGAASGPSSGEVPAGKDGGAHIGHYSPGHQHNMRADNSSQSPSRLHSRSLLEMGGHVDGDDEYQDDEDHAFPDIGDEDDYEGGHGGGYEDYHPIEELFHEPYDCHAGLEHFEEEWSQAKKEWCCHDQGLGCSADHFDCHDGLDHFEREWSQLKIQWCCRNENLGCTKCDDYECPADHRKLVAAIAGSIRCKMAPCKNSECCELWGNMDLRHTPTPAPTPPPPTPAPTPAPTPSPTHEEPFHCEGGLLDSVLGWSHEKKEWCCEHYDIGCPDWHSTVQFPHHDGGHREGCAHEHHGHGHHHHHDHGHHGSHH